MPCWRSRRADGSPVPTFQRQSAPEEAPEGAATAVATLYVFHRTPVRTFGNMFVADAFGDLLTILTCLTVMAMLVYSRSYLAARGLFRGETFVLAMFALLGMLVMISANHFLTLYLGLELMSLSLYAMVALYRESGAAVEAAPCLVLSSSRQWSRMPSAPSTSGATTVSNGWGLGRSGRPFAPRFMA